LLKVNDRISIPLKEFKFSFARSPGPGGQNVNKLNTKVILKWSLENTTSLPQTVLDRLRSKYRRRIAKSGEFVVTSHRFRDQGRNVADALNKLREMILSVAEEPKKRKPAKKSKASNRRRLEEKRRNFDKKRSRSGNFPRND
jgi:ribosome-associated protein